VPDHLLSNRLPPLLAEGLTVVDTRPAAAFAAAHIPGTINLPHNNDFTTWAGWLLDYDRPFYLITATSTLPQVMGDLTYIGLDNAAGYFDLSTVAAWRNSAHPLQSYEMINPTQLAERMAAGQVSLVDVRNDHEWQAGHIRGAQHLMLGYLPERLVEIPAGKPVVVQCQSGARSAIGASILQARGITAVLNLQGGLNDWRAAGLPIEG
jgi:hydroxyacylglutathione hydrolase